MADTIGGFNTGFDDTVNLHRPTLKGIWRRLHFTMAVSCITALSQCPDVAAQVEFETKT